MLRIIALHNLLYLPTKRELKQVTKSQRIGNILMSVRVCEQTKIYTHKKKSFGVALISRNIGTASSDAKRECCNKCDYVRISYMVSDFLS